MRSLFVKHAEQKPRQQIYGVPTQVAHDLAVAADGLLIYDGVPLTIERMRDKPDGFRVSFPASGVAWIPDGAQETSDIVLMVSSYDKKGKLLHRDGHVIGFNRQPLAEDQVENRVLHVLATIAIALPAARVRVIVRANGSGKIGAGNYFLSQGSAPSDPSTASNETK